MELTPEYFDQGLKKELAPAATKEHVHRAVGQEQVVGITPDLFNWQIEGRSPVIRTPYALIQQLADVVMSGYKRYPWGGVECGGVLYGVREPDGVRIESREPIECEHAQGPSFELSEADLNALDSQLIKARDRHLTPVGWYRSVSQYDLSLADCDMRLYTRAFPEPWHVALILKRSKDQPVRLGFFFREANGSVERYSGREFSVADAAPKQTQLPPIPQMTPQPASLDPFSQTPDPALFWDGPQYKVALARLVYGVQSRKGFLTLLGPAGTGKTMVLECLMDHLKERSIEFVHIDNSRISTPELFAQLASDLALNCANDSKTSVLIALNERLLQTLQEGGTAVLIVDNADNLALDVIEEIELLGNLENRKGKLLQVIFSAQPGFAEVLDDPRLRGLRQRISVGGQLKALREDEAGAYIRARLRKGGLAEGLLAPGLLQNIHARTAGIPRAINSLCGSLWATHGSTDLARLSQACNLDDIGKSPVDQC